MNVHILVLESLSCMHMIRSFSFLIVLFTAFQPEVFAQFEIHEISYERTYKLETKDTIETNYIFYLNPASHPNAVEKINETLFKNVFDSYDDKMDYYDSIFLDEYYNRLKHGYNYEILENSEKYLSIHVSYHHFGEERRTEEYFTFLTVTGELVSMWELFKGNYYFEIADSIIKNFNVDLKAYINAIDTSTAEMQSQYHNLLDCYHRKFSETYHYGFGYFYLSSEGLHCISPLCAQEYGKHDKTDWFQTDINFEEIKPYCNERIVNYIETGVWEYTLTELSWKAPRYEGTKNGIETVFRFFKKDGLYQGILYDSYLEYEYTIYMTIYKNVVIMRPVDESVPASFLSYQNGIISGTYKCSEYETFELVIELSQFE